MYFNLIMFCAFFDSLATTAAQPVQQHEHVHLWKITHSKMEKPSYLLGTLHVSWKILYNIFPENIKSAILETDFIVTEANNEHNSKLITCIVKRGASKLLKKSELNKRIKNASGWWIFIHLCQLPSDWLFIVLGQIHLEWQLKAFDFFARNFFSTFDKKVNEIGKSNRKETLDLDEEEDLCNILRNVNDDQILLLLEKKLDLIEEETKDDGNNSTKDMVESYKKRELTDEKYLNYYFGINGSREEQLDKAYKQFTHYVRTVRNNKWINKMHKWMNDRNSNGQKSYFFAVGLMHIISA